MLEEEKEEGRVQGGALKPKYDSIQWELTAGEKDDVYIYIYIYRRSPSPGKSNPGQTSC